jgi:hypothetical protein
MCNCNNKAGFEQYISKAQAIEKQTKTTYVVYVKIINQEEQFYIRPLSDIGTVITDVKEYFLTDKTKKKHIPTPKKTHKEVKEKEE